MEGSSQGQATILAFLLLASSVGASWVAISQAPEKASSADGWVHLQGHRLHPDKGFNPSAIGNLQGVNKLPPLWGARNHALVAPVDVGTPSQRLSCMLDATSADIWLPSIRCDSCSADSKELKSFFAATKSKTFSPQTELTLFGRAPRLVRIVDSGGSIAGYIVNDTIRFGGVQASSQPFVLAEEGGPAARRERTWDGVCGIGRRKSERGVSPSFHTHLREAGKPEMYVIAPGPSRDDGGEVARLAVGVMPSTLTNSQSDIGTFSWVKAVTTGLGASGGWTFEATAAVQGLPPQPARVTIETGTSFLLVPAHLYLRVVNTLLPGGLFEKLCGIDKEAGNVVICDCEARRGLVSEVTFDFEGEDGMRHGLAFKAEDLFEEVPAVKSHWMASQGGLCVLQVQQRPNSAVLDSPFGVLGQPFMGAGARAHPGPFPGSVLETPHGGLPGMMIPMGLRDGPVMWPLAPHGSAPVMPSAVRLPLPATPPSVQVDQKELRKELQTEEKALESAVTKLEHAMEGPKDPNSPGGLLGSLLSGLGKLGAGNSVFKEEISEYLGDGQRCLTEITRAGNGTVLEKKSWLIGKDGSKKVAHGPVGMAPPGLRGAMFPPGFGGRRLLSRPGDLWVIGDVLLRRHAVALDFENSRIGIAEYRGSRSSAPSAPSSPAAYQTTGGSIEALKGADVSAIQRFEASDASEQASKPEEPLQAPEHLESDVPISSRSGHASMGLLGAALFMGAGAAFGLLSRAGQPPCVHQSRQPVLDAMAARDVDEGEVEVPSSHLRSSFADDAAE
eukprot:CAMPEP_0115153502 /NCGR_PEP_ID=MMETSP0227-20121206/66765_1 /TAXON_ID=89957 /ORGANISM="Polarella glacialis, Strain CCMP 1383" /LENGTH=785 /DNA_ID=CAMNT_0002564255 /DNA_START=45 /DNA_END=2403 /DNA_ORIENTATION=+